MRKLKLIFMVMIMVFSMFSLLSYNEVYAKTLKIQSFSMNCGSTVKKGRTIKLKVKARDGNGTKKYKFRYQYNHKLYTIKNYSKSNSVSFQPKKTGTYQFYAYVKDKKKTVLKKKTIKVVNPYSVSLSIKGKYVDNNIKLSAQTTGGSGTKLFKFAYKYNGKTFTIKNYSKTKTVNFKPKKAGTYQFYVTSKDSRKNIKTTSQKVKVVIKPLLLSLKVNNKNIVIHDTIQLKASTSGGVGEKKYKYSYQLNGKTYLLDDYSSKSSLSMKLHQNGEYVFYVKVKDSRGSIKQSTIKVKVYTPTLKLDKLKADFSSSLTLKKVKLSTTSHGNIGTLLTRFSYKKDGKVHIIKHFSKSKTCIFKPKEYGNYIFYAEIKDNRNQIIKKSYAIDYTPLRLNSGLSSATVGTTKKIIKDMAKDTKLSYSSSNQSVCKVDSDYGFIMPISQGKAKITITAICHKEKVKKSFYVQVKDNPKVLVGCDISKYQGKISGEKLKATGMDYVILRAGHGLELDSRFVENVKQCQNNQLKYGVYWYSEALNTKEAIGDANRLYSQLKKAGIKPGSKNFTFPIYYDLEDSQQRKLKSLKIENITRAFVTRLNQLGISTKHISIYANKNWYENYLDRKYYYQTFGNRLWYARYNKPGSCPTFYWDCVQKTIHGKMWQVGSAFKNVPGVSSRYLDMDYYYQ